MPGEPLPVSQQTSSDPKEPPRGPLPPEIEKAARKIHRAVWGEEYKPGEGPMHHAGGVYRHNRLHALADSWERLAGAARLAATFLPDTDGEQR